MGRSLAIAFICSLGLAAFSAGCSSDDGPGGNGAAGTTSGVGGAAAMGGTGGAAAMGGASGAGAMGGTGGMAGTGGAGAMGGTGGMAGTGGAGGTGGDSGTGGMSASDGKTWSHLGYDQTNTYFNPGEKTITPENAGTLVEKWVFPTGGVPHGGLSIAEGKVFAATLGGVYAIDLKLGTQLWHQPAVVSDGTATYHEGFVYVHSQTAIIYKLNASDGTIAKMSEKTYNITGADGTSSPTIGGGFVVVGHSAGLNETSGMEAPTSMSKGGVEAFNIDDLSRAWTYNTVEGEEDGAMVWSTVSIDLESRIVFAATGNNYTVAGPNSDAIHAIDLDDGTLVWKKQVRTGDQWSSFSPNSQDTDFGANPILGMLGDKKVVACGDKGSAFWVLDRETGDILWSKEALSPNHAPQNGGVLNNGAFDGSRFYISSNNPGPNNAMLHAFNADMEGSVAWPMKTNAKIQWGMQSVANGVLFVPANNMLLVLNAATGAELTSFNTGGAIAAGAPAIADGMVVVKSGLQYIYADIFGTGGVNMEVRAYGLP
jgi:polyvinyl alcohol dehydrogenase (cytochrome)